MQSGRQRTVAQPIISSQAVRAVSVQASTTQLSDTGVRMSMQDSTHLPVWGQATRAAATLLLLPPMGLKTAIPTLIPVAMWQPVPEQVLLPLPAREPCKSTAPPMTRIAIPTPTAPSPLALALLTVHRLAQLVARQLPLLGQRRPTLVPRELFL
jgi:hypothetical protein